MNNLEDNQSNQLQPINQLISQKQNLFRFGHLKHLSEMCKLDEHLYNPFVEFQRWFLEYHQACLLTKWTYNKKTDRPYCYVEHLGVFTDLNLLARRIKSEISSHVTNYFEEPVEKLKYWKPDADYCQDTLHISLPEEKEENKIPVFWKELQVNYIQLNNTDERYSYEGWKFDIR